MMYCCSGNQQIELFTGVHYFENVTRRGRRKVLTFTPQQQNLVIKNSCLKRERELGRTADMGSVLCGCFGGECRGESKDQTDGGKG